MKPIISIITINYNNRDGLARTQRSLETQTQWSPYAEWVIVDGGSTDGAWGTVDTCKLNDVYYKSEADEGIYDAMNRGLSRIRGDWVLFLNSGDTLASDSVLARLLESIQGRKFARDVLVGDWICILPSAEHYRKARPQRYLVHSLPSSHQSILFPTQALTDFKYDISYRVTGDYYICAWLLKAGCSFIRLGFAVARFEIGGLSYNNPVTLIREAARVQREVLGLNRLTIACSVAFRVASMTRIRIRYTLRSLLR